MNYSTRLPLTSPATLIHPPNHSLDWSWLFLAAPRVLPAAWPMLEKTSVKTSRLAGNSMLKTCWKPWWTSADLHRRNIGKQRWSKLELLGCQRSVKSATVAGDIRRNLHNSCQFIGHMRIQKVSCGFMCFLIWFLMWFLYLWASPLLVFICWVCLRPRCTSADCMSFSKARAPRQWQLLMAAL